MDIPVASSTDPTKSHDTSVIETSSISSLSSNHNTTQDISPPSVPQLDQTSSYHLTLDSDPTPTNLTLPDYTQIDQALTRKLSSLPQTIDRKSWWGKSSIQTRNGTETDNNSFFTARGTFRSYIAGEESERSVIVGWMGRVGTLRFADVCFSSHT